MKKNERKQRNISWEEALNSGTLVRAEAVAERLGIARGTVYNLVSQGKMPGAVRVFGCLRFDPQQVEQLVEAGRLPGWQDEVVAE